jgi:hypothetical protein
MVGSSYCLWDILDLVFKKKIFELSLFFNVAVRLNGAE